MQRITSNSVHKLELSMLKKIKESTEKTLNIKNIMKDINRQYPLLQDFQNFTGFDLWLYADYIDEKGRNLIEAFITEYDNSLNSIELEFLNSIRKSNLSLYEIKFVTDKGLLLKDLLQDEDISVLISKSAMDLNENDYIFARVSQLKDKNIVVGDLSIMPSVVKHLFQKNFFTAYNKKREKNMDLAVKDYLKLYSLELIENFFSCIYSAIEIDENISTYFFEELDEFEGYLRYKKNNLTIEKHIMNLIEFFDYYLSNDDLTLYDMNQVDLYEFIDDAIFDGFISSQEDLNSYIRTLKLYLSFLSNKNSIYNQAHKDIRNISDNRFLIMEKLESNTGFFHIDRNLQDKIEPMLNEEALIFLNDMDKFLLYILDKPLELTLAKAKIKRNKLIEINEIIENSHRPKSKAPNQEDFPIIELFYNIALNLDLASIDKNKLVGNYKASNFIRLSDGQKYSLLLLLLWEMEMKFVQEEFIKFARLNNLESFLNKKRKDFSYYKEISESLSYLGIFYKDEKNEYNYIITKLGRCVLEYIYNKKKNADLNPVVDISDFKKNR